MGVPSFFGWLTKRYPSVIINCVEEKKIDINEVKIPVDTLGANPNNVEFDNLYLDMNGIIHPCTHPEDKLAPLNEDEMMIAIFEYVDRIFKIVRPRKLLYLSIDGVAPRAKMNQQRSRRFRAVKEAARKFEELNRAREELLLKGATLPPKEPERERFDSNCISPGTPFMARLSECLNYYVHEKVNNDPGWANIKVILSDANVPGEGEHKILDFIRKQRAQPNHDPNTHHCLYGSDADFIMLGLATHEANFTIIRKNFKSQKPKPCDLCGVIGHDFQACTGIENRDENTKNFKRKKFESKSDYIFVRLNVLREYLERDLQMPNLPFPYDFERAIDDWVCICLFIGNDFLPRLPSLDLREGAMNKLVKLYKDVVYKTNGYLTENGNVNLDRVEMILSELGKIEDQTFKTRRQNKLNYEAREKAKKQEHYDKNTKVEQSQALDNAIVPAGDPKHEIYESQKVKSDTVVESMSLPLGASCPTISKQEQKLLRDENDNEEEDSHDDIKLWKEGFKDRYYESKFGVKKENLQFRSDVAFQYIKGLCWVLQYYYQGCPSWKWYFPYYYPPFASDFDNTAKFSIEFEKETKPFNPLEQLMGVLPASSRSQVPEAWADLMINETSPVINLYPKDFKIDLNGNKNSWQGVALLPFVDEDKLVSELAKVYNKLTPAEKQRNMLENERLYIGLQHQRYEMIKTLTDTSVESDIVIDGIQGTILQCQNRVGHGETLQSPLKSLPLIENIRVCCVNFRCLKYPEGFVFPLIRLQNALEPLRVLKPQDFERRNENVGPIYKNSSNVGARKKLDVPRLHLAIPCAI